MDIGETALFLCAAMLAASVVGLLFEDHKRRETGLKAVVVLFLLCSALTAGRSLRRGVKLTLPAVSQYSDASLETLAAVYTSALEKELSEALNNAGYPAQELRVEVDIDDEGRIYINEIALQTSESAQDAIALLGGMTGLAAEKIDIRVTE